MSHNEKCVTLSKVNNKFTEDVLINILSKIYNGQKVQLTDWSFNEESAKGDNYLSNIYKGKVNGTIDGNPEQYVQANIVVKSIPNNPATRKTLRCADFFRNEIVFYTQIISKFKSFLAEKGQSDLLCVPRHIISSADNEYGFIVLEDVSSLGFHTISRYKCLDWSECSAILKTLSKFHAISFAYKDQRKEEFVEMTDSLKEIIFNEHFDWYKKLHENTQTLIKHALATEYPDSKAETQYNSYKLGELYNKCTELCERKDAPTSVVVQGDCWGPNFLIRDIGQDQKQALILDFQLARCASPILDLSFLIYACTLKSFRNEYFDEILKTYHSELSDAIKLLGSDPEKLYPWSLFMKEVNEQSVYGVIGGLDAIPLCLIDVSESFSIDTAITGDTEIDFDPLIDFPRVATASARQRLADVIVDAVEKGYM